MGDHLIYRKDHTLCDKEFEWKGAVVGRAEQSFNQPICQPIKPEKNKN
jgi:hypothetical protein